MKEKKCDMPPHKYVMYYAKKKVVKALENFPYNSIIFGFDTIIYFQNSIIGKPKNKIDALNILMDLNDNIHSVYTGISCLSNNFAMVDYEFANVKFQDISKEEWAAYITNNSVLDKAGAYGIQDLPAGYADVIEGRIETVIGIPIEKLKKCLERTGLWNLKP